MESERGSEKEIPNWYWHIKLTSNFTDVDETNRSDCQSITHNQTEIRSLYYERQSAKPQAHLRNHIQMYSN